MLFFLLDLFLWLQLGRIAHAGSAIHLRGGKRSLQEGPHQGRIVGGYRAEPYDYRFYVQMERGCG